jgi:hypothetical protein
MNHLGHSFSVLTVGKVDLPPLPDGVRHVAVGDAPVGAIALDDVSGQVAKRYSLNKAYLVRPDQHIAARFDGGCSAETMHSALARACGSLQ